MPGDPKECRRLARECARLAQTAPSVRLRADYLAFAHKWLQLAAIYESDGELIKGLGYRRIERCPTAPRRPIKLRAS